MNFGGLRVWFPLIGYMTFVVTEVRPSLTAYNLGQGPFRSPRLPLLPRLRLSAACSRASAAPHRYMI
jgi:hypothetical protein